MAIEALPPQVAGSVACGRLEHRLALAGRELVPLDHAASDARDGAPGLCGVLAEAWARAVDDPDLAPDVLPLALTRTSGPLPTVDAAVARLAGRVGSAGPEVVGDRLALQAVLAELPQPLLDELAALVVERLAQDWPVRPPAAAVLGHQLEAWLRPRLRALGHEVPPGRRGLVVHLTSPGGLPFPVLAGHAVTLHLPVDVVPDLLRTGDANLVYPAPDGRPA